MKPNSLKNCMTIDYSDMIGMPYTTEHDCNWVVAEVFRRFGQFYPDVETPEDPAERDEAFQQAFIKYGECVTDITPCTVMTFCFREPGADDHMPWRRNG